MALQTTFWKKNDKENIFATNNSEINVENKAKSLIRRSTGSTVYAVGQVCISLFMVIKPKFVY